MLRPAALVITARQQGDREVDVDFGEVGPDSQGLLVFFDRLIPLPLSGEVHSHVLKWVRRVRLKFVRPNQPFHRLVELALVREHDSQVHQRIGRVGLVVDCQPEILARLVDLVLFVQGESQVGQYPKVVRLDLVRPPVDRLGLGRPALPPDR
jgi:hypothetical protein